MPRNQPGFTIVESLLDRLMDTSKEKESASDGEERNDTSAATGSVPAEANSLACRNCGRRYYASQSIASQPWKFCSQRCEKEKSGGESFRKYRESVKRDLEWLLNTRQIFDPDSEDLREVSRSLYFYGLPDIASMGLHSSRDRDRLLRVLEKTIQKFEPRIADARVTLEPLLPDSRCLKFRIEGLLRMDPAPEPITFNTVLELSSGEYELEEVK